MAGKMSKQQVDMTAVADTHKAVAGGSDEKLVNEKRFLLPQHHDGEQFKPAWASEISESAVPERKPPHGMRTKPLAASTCSWFSVSQLKPQQKREVNAKSPAR